MSKTATIAWAPLSEKHKKYIRMARHSRMCVAEGAIRSGKTIDHCILACMYLENCTDRIHLASGSTLGNAKLNIGDCNGFGLEHLFRGRCRWGKYKDNEALYIQTKTGEKIVIFTGGGKADSYKRILGNSYGLWIATEINEHYDADDSRSSFIKVAFGRQLAANQPYVLWDLNPCNPGHQIYTNYIDKYKETMSGYLYEHFTIDDNLSISEDRKAEIKQQYVPGSVWYRRDIEGERCVAEGLIYPMYESVLVKELPKEYSKFALSIDYGTQNAFAAIIWGENHGTWYAIQEYYYSGRAEQKQKADDEYADDMVSFTSWLFPSEDEDGNTIPGLITGKLETIIDPSAASFIAILKKRDRFKVRAANNDVLNGLRETATAMNLGFIKVSDNLKYWKMEVAGYTWDDQRGEEYPIQHDDHLMDSTRYFCKTKHLVRKGMRGNA